MNFVQSSTRFLAGCSRNYTTGVKQSKQAFENYTAPHLHSMLILHLASLMFTMAKTCYVFTAIVNVVYNKLD